MKDERPKIAPTPENILAVRKRYYGKPALFMTEVLGMELDTWQQTLCDEFHDRDRHAISSGHSSGKTAFSAGMIYYFISVHPDPQIIVTANTELQLKQKTWRELAKWHNKSMLRDWFTWTATTFSLKGAEETWFAAAVPNTPHGAEGFAGAHEKYILQIFDEASAIDRVIWETAEGATATEGGYRKWLVFGNPTRGDGAFFDCFHSKTHRWNTKYLDTRQCKYADQSQIKEWEEDFGEDSDFFRIRVRGLFPKESIVQLIGRGTIERAVDRQLMSEAYYYAPKVIGVDIARFGDDATVITKRQGLQVDEPIVIRKFDTMQVASRVADELLDWHPQAVFCDETGLGAGVVDRLHQLNHKCVIGVNSSESPSNPLYLNKRAEMWCELRDWLKAGGSLPNHQRIKDDLATPEYFFNKKGKLQLESKDEMKKRTGVSPDFGDSLALTHAHKVAVEHKERVLTQAEKDWRDIVGIDSEIAFNLED